jgi:hypothetical protein
MTMHSRQDAKLRYDQGKKLLPHIPKDTLFVFEMSPRRTKEEITTSLAKWKERFGA